MNKSDKKRMRRELEEREEKRGALSKTRRLDEDIHYRGVGILKIQLMVIPSFEKGVCWDFRELDNTLKIYKACIDPAAQILGPGYFEAIATEDLVSGIVRTLKGLELPLLCDMNDLATLDGTTYKVRITSGYDNVIGITWGGNTPNEWGSFISSISKTLEKLDQLKVRELNA